MANIIALVCSAAFPTSGSNMTLINVTGIPHAVDAPCKTVDQIRKKIIKKVQKRTIPKFHSKINIFCKISKKTNGISFGKQTKNLNDLT